jgi:hypothetical protein
MASGGRDAERVKLKLEISVEVIRFEYFFKVVFLSFPLCLTIFFPFMSLTSGALWEWDKVK